MPMHPMSNKDTIGKRYMAISKIHAEGKNKTKRASRTKRDGLSLYTEVK